MNNQKRVMFLGVILLVLPLVAGAVEIQFKKHIIDRGTAESCCVFDVNKDGRLDIYCGDNWYVGPTWERRETREAPYSGEYKNSCADWPFDVIRSARGELPWPGEWLVVRPPCLGEPGGEPDAGDGLSSFTTSRR